MFGTKSSTTLSTDNPTGVSSYVRSWEDELLSEIGNNLKPPTFPLHPPSKPPLSHPRSFSVAMNNQAAATVVHEPGPTPQPRPPFPAHGASLDSDLNAECPVPSLVVNTKRPRPRPLNHADAPPEYIPPSISVIPQVQVPVDVHPMPNTSFNGQVTNTVITLLNAINADLQLKVARLSINPDPERPESAPRSGHRVRATTSSASKSKVGAIAAYPVGAASKLGEIAAVPPVAPIGRTTCSRKRAN